MKHFNILFTIITFLIIGVGCTPSNLSYSEAQNRNSRKLETEALRNDAAFLVDAANYNLLLSEMANRAVQQGYARIVTDFAATAVADHRRMHDDIRKLAKDKKIALPSTMSDRYQQMSNELAVTDKTSFDKTYLRNVELLHEQAMRMFEDAALRANDSNIRAFAASKLDMIRSHERKANELENQLL